MKQIPVNEFAFPEPGSEHFKLTCKNHPTAEYSTKNPFLRNLHLLKFPDGMHSECDCPFDDLVVLVEE